MFDFLRKLNIDPQDYPRRRGRLPVKSNKQFAFFRGKKRLQLDSLVYGFTGRPAPYGPDLAAYETIKKSMQKSSNRDDVAAISAKILHQYVQKYAPASPKKYLDLGCGNCLISRELARLLEVQAHGSDVKETFEANWDSRPPEVAFKYVTEAQPLGHSGKWDLITAIMVLHHIPNPDETIKAISQSLQPGGLLILKEHDCINETEEILVDIEHNLFIVQNNTDWKDRIYKLYTKCRSWVDWAWLMHQNGLQLLHYGPWGYMHPKYGDTRKCILVFQKMN